MLSLKQCRKILGPSCSLSDADLEQYRDNLYVLADIAFEAYPKFKQSKTKTSINQQQVVSFESMLNLLSEAEREQSIERVSMMEFEDKQSRKDAEKTLISKHFKNQNQGN